MTASNPQIPCPACVNAPTGRGNPPRHAFQGCASWELLQRWHCNPPPFPPSNPCQDHETLVRHLYRAVLALSNERSVILVANERRSESVQAAFIELFSPSFAFKKVRAGCRAAQGFPTNAVGPGLQCSCVREQGVPLPMSDKATPPLAPLTLQSAPPILFVSDPPFQDGGGIPAPRD